MRLVRVASGSASPTVVIMVGPVCVGTPRTQTQEATVCSATDSFRDPVPVGRDVVEAARRHTPAAPMIGGEVTGDR